MSPKQLLKKAVTEHRRRQRRMNKPMVKMAPQKREAVLKLVTIEIGQLIRYGIRQK